jgi:hypothetical protein
MAADIQLNFGTTTAFTITLNSLGDTSGVNSSSVDLGNPAPVSIGIHVVLDGASASNTDFVEWYIKWSEDNSAFTDDNNAEPVKATLMNGTTAVDHVFAVPVQARYMQLRAVNESGAGLAASGNSAEYYEIAVDQA